MKKKILFMVQVPPPVHGAALRNLSLFESKLLHENFDIRLEPLTFADSIFDIGKMSGKKVLKSFRYAIRLARTILSFKPDMAYFTITPSGGAFYRDCLFVLILKMLKIPIVYHLRGLGIGKSRTSSRLNKILYSFAFKNTFVICLSQSQLHDIKGLKYTKHFVVPNGIKTEVNPAWEQASNSKQQILFLSNFIKSKGVLEFLQALKKLKTQEVEFEALLVGANYNLTKEDIQQFIDTEGLSDSVKVSGPRFNEEKFRLIHDCDIFVLPTYFELFPGVVLEAMQCGKPVVSTFTGAIPEIIDNGVNGLLVPCRDVDELASKIKYLVDHPNEARHLGNSAKEKFYKEFTFQKFEENMRQVFAEVC